MRAAIIKEQFHVFSQSLTVRVPFEQVFHRDPTYARATTKLVVACLLNSMVYSIFMKPVQIAMIDFVERLMVGEEPVEVPA